MPSFLLHGGTIVRSDENDKSDVYVKDGVITSIDTDLQAKGAKKEDCTEKILFPGFIDCHVHFREPGLEHKATMRTEAAAARSGGVTTVCEMPNTDPPTCTIGAFNDKVLRASKITDADIHFFFGATKEEHLDELGRLLTGKNAELTSLRARCCGIKLYFDHSTGNQKAEDDVIEKAFALCAEHRLPVVCHCEDGEMNALALKQNTRDDVAAHSQIRSAQSEVNAIERAINLARKHGTHLHIAHLSTSGGLQLIRAAKEEKLHVTCEVTPHHLFLTTDDYEKLGTLMKVNPPIRSHEHREALWQGIEDGTIDCISTDHAPHTIEEKRHPEALRAPSGLPGVETMIPLLLTVAAGQWPNPIRLHPSSYRLSYADILRLCFENPNKIFKLGKLDIKKGSTTDIVIVDPNTESIIKADQLHSKCGWTPYEGWHIKGVIEGVIS